MERNNIFAKIHAKYKISLQIIYSILDDPSIKNILIEVKYREGTPVADDDAISELREEASAAIIVTKNADDYGVQNTKSGKKMLRIPAYAFLYLLGNAEKHGYRAIEQ